MSQALVGIGFTIALVVVFALTYRHKAGGCTGGGTCGSCNGAGHCSSGVGDEQ